MNWLDDLSSRELLLLAIIRGVARVEGTEVCCQGLRHGVDVDQDGEGLPVLDGHPSVVASLRRALK